MEDEKGNAQREKAADESTVLSRRDFLSGLRKWSTAVIGVAIAGGVLLPGEANAGWINRRGGGWVNGGGSWINRGGGGWINGHGGGGSWVNRRGW